MTSYFDEASLSDLFKTHTLAAIGFCEAVLCHLKEFTTFDEFIEYVKKNEHLSTCQKSWAAPELAIHCHTCEEQEQSCICFECYLNGNHEGHAIIFKPNVIGSCDCGDLSLWKQSGFCCHHQNVCEHPEEKYLEKDIMNILISIFTCASKYVHEIAKDKPSHLIKLIDWFLKFVNLGDGCRRCVVLGFTKNDSFYNILNNALDNKLAINKKIVELFGCLLIDNVFSEYFANANFRCLITYMKYWYESPENERNLTNLRPLSSFLFHSYSMKPLQLNINNQNFDWISLYIKVLELTREYSLRMVGNENKNILFPQFDFAFLHQIINAVIRIPNEHKNMILLLNKITSILLKPDERGITNINEITQIPHFPNILYNIYIGITLQEMEHLEEIDSKYLLEKFDNYYTELYGNENNEQLLKCSLFDNAIISTNFESIFFLVSVLDHEGDKIKEILQTTIKDLDKFLQYVSINLQRNLISIYFYNHSIINKCFGYINFLEIFTEHGDLHFRLFVLLQYCAGYITKKEQFINCIAHTIGLFDEKIEKKQLIQFDFIYLISTLITDRILMLKDDKAIKSQRLVKKLLFKPRPFNEIQDLLNFGEKLTEVGFKYYIDNVTSTIHTSKGNLYRLKSIDLWDPLAPVHRINKVLTVYSKYISQNPDQLIPFKPLNPEIKGLDLVSYLFTPTLITIIYLILLENKSNETNQLILNLLILAFENKEKSNNEINIKDEPIKVNTIEEFINNIPNNFESIMKQKFIYKDNEPYSLIDLIHKLGKIGKIALNKMSFVDTETNDEEVQEENNINHEKAQKLRENILNKFAQLQQHFNQKDQEENDNNNEDLNINQQKDTCCVCSINQENEVLCYPSFIIKTHLPLEFDGDKEWDAVYGFSICKHLSHDDCLPINCPIDRMLKNSFIPKLDNIKDFETETVKETLRKFKRIMDLDEDDNVNILANSLTSLIVTYEVRLRSNPACLDNDKYSIMARNLYLCIRQLVKMGDVLYDEYTKWTNFRHFICDLITAENPKDEIKNITKKCAGELNGKELTLFLKRVKLAEHFLLYNSSEHNSYIDWDEILSNENLCHEYEFEFNGEEYTFEPYKLINLPKNFFMLGKEPYNALNEIKNSQTQYYICLHNGKIIKENERLKALEENDYDPVPLMALNIKHTEPSFVFENRGRGMFYTQEPFYLDFLGNPDVGLNNMHLLYLSEEGYEHFVDRYLSADYIR